MFLAANQSFEASDRDAGSLAAVHEAWPTHHDRHDICTSRALGAFNNEHNAFFDDALAGCLAHHIIKQCIIRNAKESAYFIKH